MLTFYTECAATSSASIDIEWEASTLPVVSVHYLRRISVRAVGAEYTLCWANTETNNSSHSHSCLHDSGFQESACVWVKSRSTQRKTHAYPVRSRKLSGSCKVQTQSLLAVTLPQRHRHHTTYSSEFFL